MKPLPYTRKVQKFTKSQSAFTCCPPKVFTPEGLTGEIHRSFTENEDSIFALGADIFKMPRWGGLSNETGNAHRYLLPVY